MAPRSNLRLTALALALASIGAPAQTVTWANDTSGLWTLPTNWTPLGPPPQGSDVVITVTGVKTITHDAGNDSIHTLMFEAGTPDPNALLLVNTGSSLTVTSGGTNGGVIRADNGTVSFTGGTLVNNGTLNAINGGVVNITSGAVVSGGTLSTASGGQVTISNSAGLDGVSNGAITNLGKLVEADGQTTYFSGMIVNNGGITVGTDADFRLVGANNGTFSGTGTVTLNAGNSRLFADQGGDVLTFGSGQTVQGQGNIGLNQTVIRNAGVITANVNGGTLTLDPTDGEGNFINTGTLRAENSGTLQLLQGNYTNQGATITALAGSAVVITNSAQVAGGTVSTAGTGTATFYNSAVIDGSTHGAISLTGNVAIGDGQTVYALGTVNDNTLTIGTDADLRIAGTNTTLTLANNGTTTLVAGNSRIFSDTGSASLVNTAGNTIQGQGSIGVNQTSIQNAGLITANVNGGTLTLDPTDGQGNFVNTGALRAENGGNLQFFYGTYDNGMGTITARAGSTVTVTNAAIIQGGTVNTVADGAVTFYNSAVMDGSTRGPLTLSGNNSIADGQTVYGLGVINDNTLKVGTDADFRIAGANSLTLQNGTTTLVAGNSRIFGDNGSDVLTNAATNVIQGQGQIGANQAFLVNRGLITSNVNGGTITLDPTDGDATNGGLINTGVLRAENGGSLQLFFGHYNNAGGTIAALDGSNVAVTNGAIIEGGLLTSSGSGAITFYNSAVLNGTAHGALTNTGNLVIGANQVVYGTGSIVDNGTITQQADSDVRLQGTSNLTLSGTGTYTMTAGNARIFGDDGGDTLTNGAGHTINGFGQIGINQLQVTNAGSINANVSGQTITLNTTGAVVNQSTGVLQASNGGTLYVDKAITGTGTIRTDSGGTVILNQAAQTGQLINNANLSIGTNNVTVSADYNNANFGTGNSFNKHSNVTGTGQILASGDVAQAITGSTVTNGAGANPTLTIGNVRVGGTTYNYQVANTGTTGPSLRGAIETSVNGGNITDARLSGSGVTAGNYGPVATGSNSGNLAVTFTASSAGALAPLSGQAVHIANNFDNVSEQTLNIVLGAGAAAYNAAVGSTTPTPVTIANQRVGGTGSQALTVANTAATGNFSEALDAGFSGMTGAATSNGGSVSNIAAGSSNTGALSVGVNTATSGAKTGNVTIAYQTDGTGSNGHSGLAAIGAGSQTIAVSGNVYQAATGSVLTAPLNFGTVQVGQNVNQQLTVQNTATGAAGYVEDLNASFGASNGTGASRITGTGSVNGLVAGATSNGLTVHVDTTSAGTVSGGIAVNFATAGTVNGVSNGLGTASAGSTNYGVMGTIATSGTVVDQANPVINNSPLALGNVRIGSTSPTGTVSVTNQATGNQQAALDASISGNAPITASGSFNLLAPGATDASSLHVGFDTSTAGSKNGTATIAFTSDASNIGNCGANCQMTIASQNVDVTGAVYRLANPTVATPSVTVAGRVGTTASPTAIGITNASPDVYTEGLTATRGATSAGFTSSGSITNLGAGQSSNAIAVTLNTATAGTFSGTQALNFVSTGAGTDNATDMTLGSQTVTLNGKVYTPAVAQNNTASVNFGTVHVGDTVAAHGVSVTNAAPVTALNDVLVASAAGATGPFTAGGSLGAGLAAGQTSTNGLSVGLNTMAAGTYSGTATFSAASHDGDLSDAALANLAVSLTGQVNNYATDAFRFGSGSGTLTQMGSTYVLDFGTVAQGSSTESATLFADNSATGPADLLDGSFQLLDAEDFDESGLSAFMNLAAGQDTGPLSFSFNTANAGSFSDTILLHGVGHNDSGYSGAIGDIELIVRGDVSAQGGGTTNVPEPDTLVLLGLGVPLIFLRRARRGARRSAD